MVGPLTSTQRTGFDRQLFREGDPSLFRRLVREVSPRLLGMIRSYASDDDHADELLQESWVQIYRKRAKFSGRGSFPGWALAVSRNVCRMSLRGGIDLVASACMITAKSPMEHRVPLPNWRSGGGRKRSTRLSRN